MSNMVGIENLILKRNTKGQQMRVITLVLVIVAVFFFAKDAHGRTIMIDEESVETVEGQTFYVLTTTAKGQKKNETSTYNT